jgi:hypothetical protein
MNPTQEQSTINVFKGSPGSSSTNASVVGTDVHGFVLFSVWATL